MLPRLFALLLVAGLVVSCQTPGTPDEVRHRVEPPLVSAIVREPQIRVRIVAAEPQVTLSSSGPLIIGPIASQRRLTQPRSFTPPVTVARRDGRFLLTHAGGQTIAWNLPALNIEAADGGRVTVNGDAYPGHLVAWPVTLKTGHVTNQIDLVNHVPMEQYLPGVLERELYPKWPLQTYIAQAIAARTYAIAEQSLHRHEHFDLTSTTASQVYGGHASNPTAIEAVRRTRGQVLAYAGRIIPAYFSSSSGGVGQDATAAFPDSPWVVDIPPLRGRVHTWGRSSQHYRWGPITRDAAALSRRIAAWGRAERHAVAGVGTVTGVRVIRRSSTGRPAVFELVDDRGQRFELPAEWFRFACNYAGGGQGKLDFSQQLRSSNVAVSVRGGRVMFTNGRGFGHGVGMCQWSARDMAEAGYTGRAIVEFFYPGATVQRAY